MLIPHTGLSHSPLTIVLFALCLVTTAAQCGHAVYGLTKKLQQSSPATLAQWESCGQAKIALRADGGVPQLVC